MKQRCTEPILLFIPMDSQALSMRFKRSIGDLSQAKYQTCCVHVARNIAHKVCVTNRAEICEDFKSVYRSDDKQQVKRRWQPSVIKGNRLVWRNIYPTNLIESFNKQIKKYTKRKNNFHKKP